MHSQSRSRSRTSSARSPPIPPCRPRSSRCSASCSSEASERAWRVASTLFWLILLVLGGVTALFILLAPLLMRPFGDPGGDFDLAVALSRVLFPIVVLLGSRGSSSGSSTYHHFALPALAPVAWNLVIIIGLLIGVPRIDDERASSTSTPALSSSGRSSRCCCRSRGCGGSTAASRWSSTGEILQFAACSR